MSGQVGRNERRPLRTMPWWVGVIGAVAVAASTTVTTLWLLSIAGHDASLRIEAIKVGLSVGAGSGGAVALSLAVRRQWLSERTQAHAEDVARITQAHMEAVARDNAYDATQRRVTELYGKAVEQLGHANAPVRLGGLYSLERLAQDHNEHRQTVVDVVCAYLRMPFQPASSATADEQQPATDKDSGDRSKVTGHDGSNTKEELQVRLAAQRLLARHLALPDEYRNATDHTATSDTYWGDMRIDLRGAHLVDFDFSECRPDNADFRNARFSGGTRFYGAQFSGYARFGEAQFSGDAWFGEAQFSGDAWFREAQFSGSADFRRARFSWHASFAEAQFSGDAWFVGAQFGEDAVFVGAQFGEDAVFVGAQFSTQPNFEEAIASSPNERHSWPDGWRIKPSAPPGMAPLVRRQ